MRLVILLFLMTAVPARGDITVGAYVNDIQNLELKSHSYSVDIYLWFRWRDKKNDPSETFEFMNAYELWGHTKTKTYEKPILLKNGEYYQIVRVQGRFSTKLSLEHYPFDRQLLLVEFEDQDRDTGSMQYKVDSKPITINASLILPGFKIGAPEIAVLSSTYPTMFGELNGSLSTSAYSRVRITLPIERPVFTYTLKLLLPILCVVFSALLMFFFHPKYVDSRVGIGITALLTIVALQITLNDDLPEIEYLVLMDKIYICAYLFVIAGLAVIVKSTYFMDRENLNKAISLDRKWLLILLVGFFTAVSTLILTR